LQVRREKFGDLFAHISYRANLCMPNNSGLYILRKEIAIARRLEFTHVIVHPGSAKHCVDKRAGIEQLARTLNIITRRLRDIKIVLENTAHGNLSIGSDLNDFIELREHLEFPEKIKFCIDTAHAYSYGYNIVDNAGQAAFLDLIAHAIGFDSLALIHLNDTDQQLGSQIDRHVLMGQGNIGEEVLRRFIEHESLRSVPVVMESPLTEEIIEQTMYQRIMQWQMLAH
jgi:deoxyribonuclease-4